MVCTNKEHKNTQCACPQLSVDYPRQGEKITGVSYAFRVSAPANVQKVDVAIDQAAWRSCRHSGGYWWFDWSGYDNGEHEVIARLTTCEGKEYSSKPHEFFVQLEKQPA